MRQKLISQHHLRLFSTTSPIRNQDVGVRVRFAPSPTGQMHLGGLRTALYNYLFAKKHGGQFIVRIEDTDQTRIVPGSADNIEQILNWATLKPDESPRVGGQYGPYFQSQRLSRYQEKAQELVDAGRAYRCFCSAERLDLLRKFQSKNRQKLHYDGKCRHLTSLEINEKLATQSAHTVRFKLRPGPTRVEDLVFGEICDDLVELQESDPIILKSDKFPTYHFANVVDDHAMKISHVLRGSEWISSTTKHVQIYESFNWRPPQFLHFPLITMKDGSKMSKRNDQSQVKNWIDAGYRPLAMINFLTNMGGGIPKEKQDANELWTLEKLVEAFDFNKVTCHSASVDLDRLRIYNQKDLQMTWSERPQEILADFKKLLASRGIEHDLSDDTLSTTLAIHVSRIAALNEILIEDNVFMWKHPNLTWSMDEYGRLSLPHIVKDLISQIQDCSHVQDKEFVGELMTNLASKYNMKTADVYKLTRQLLTNSPKGLPVVDIFSCLGKSRLLSYLEAGLSYVSEQQ